MRGIGGSGLNDGHRAYVALDDQIPVDGPVSTDITQYEQAIKQVFGFRLGL